MPLVLVCGQPSSGKTRVTAQLAELLQAKGLEVVVVDEDSVHLDRNEAYKDVPNEKNTRGLLRATTDRSLNKQTVVVLDSLNNIKGYRYELWCCARTAATRYCVVHVDTPVETCRQWNAERQGPSYESAVLEDLCGRFERPDSRNRWDAPLFTVHPLLGPDHMQQQLEAAAAAIADEPGAADARVLGQRRPAKELVPTIATKQGVTLLSATNLLHDIDRAAQAVVERVTAAQAAAGPGPLGQLAFEGEDQAVQPLLVPREVTLAELRRHKRAFLKLATNSTFYRVTDVASARRMFIAYLREQLAQH